MSEPIDFEIVISLCTPRKMESKFRAWNKARKTHQMDIFDSS